MICIVADNQPITAFAVEQLIQRNGYGEVLCAATKKELITFLREHDDTPTLVVLDFTLFNFLGCDDLLVVAERFEQTMWLLLSDELSGAMLYRLLVNHDRFGSVFKEESVEVLNSAIASLCEGFRYVSPRAQKGCEQYLRFRNSGDEREQLTRTEEEILQLLAHGLSSKEIAERRVSSVHTVVTHRKNIFRKLQVNSVFEAIRFAQRAGLSGESDFAI